MYEFHTGPFGIVGLILGIILWAAIVTALVLVIMELIRRQRRPRIEPAPLLPQAASSAAEALPVGSEALRILDERYARGELNHEEYAQRKGDLRGV